MAAPEPVESSDSSYTPAAGDVVEFEYSYGGMKIATGLVFTYRSGRFGVWHNGENRLCVGDLFSDQKNGHRKIGQSSITASMSRDAAEGIAKAYFAEQAKPVPVPAAPPPEYKVGELMEHCFDGKWETAKVTRYCGYDTDQRYEVVLKCGRERVPYSRNLRPLSGTYAERQAKAVEFYGWKVGSKVKVVRKWEEDEDGSECFEWNYTDGKAKLYGQEVVIVGINARNILYSGDCTCPYIALEPVQ